MREATKLQNQLYRAMNRGDWERSTRTARQLDAALGLPRSSDVTVRTTTQLPTGIRAHPPSYLEWVREVWPRYQEAVRANDEVEAKAEAARERKSQGGTYFCDKCGREVFSPPGEPNKRFSDVALTQGHRCGRRTLQGGVINN